MIKKILGVLSFYFPPPVNKFLHKIRGVHISDIASLWIGFGSIIDNAYPEKIFLGEHCTISSDVKIYAHFEPPKSIMEKYIPMEVKSVHIGNNVFIGTGSCILPGVKIDDWVVIGAGSVVTKDCEKYSIVAGNPAIVIGDIRYRNDDQRVL